MTRKEKTALRLYAKELKQEIEEMEERGEDHRQVACKIAKLQGIELRIKDVRRERITAIEIVNNAW